jgi:hypothetical protein
MSTSSLQPSRTTNSAYAAWSQVLPVGVMHRWQPVCARTSSGELGSSVCRTPRPRSKRLPRHGQDIEGSRACPGVLELRIVSLGPKLRGVLLRSWRRRRAVGRSW